MPAKKRHQPHREESQQLHQLDESWAIITRHLPELTRVAVDKALHGRPGGLAVIAQILVAHPQTKNEADTSLRNLLRLLVSATL